MIEIPRVARPRPAPHFNSGGGAHILENRALAAKQPGIAKQRVASGVLATQGAHFFRRILLENVLRRDAQSRSRPHVSDVKIVGSIIVIIEPANAHACADIFNSRLRRDIRERSVSIVAVKILSAEVVHHVEIGPAIAVVITPATAKAVASIVSIKATLRRNIPEGSIPIVAHHEIGRPVFRVIIRKGILILIGALIIDIEAEIDVQPAIAVIVGNGCTRESALWRVGRT